MKGKHPQCSPLANYTTKGHSKKRWKKAHNRAIRRNTNSEDKPQYNRYGGGWVD